MCLCIIIVSPEKDPHKNTVASEKELVSGEYMCRREFKSNSLYVFNFIPNEYASYLKQNIF